MKFAKVLKNIRTDLKLTQEQLARDLGISFSTLNRWEKARTKPSPLAKQTIINYFEAKNVPTEKLIILDEAE